MASSRPESEPTSQAQARYCVVFRTHFWDDFATRQLARIRSRLGPGDLYVLVDETRGAVPGITNDRVFRLTDEQLLAAGYVDAGEGSMQWYSGDVPIYLFRHAHPEYDYYVQLEYDVKIGIDLEDLVGRVAREGVDMVAFTNVDDPGNCHWTPTCLDVYRREEVRHQLFCFSIFSNRALEQLAQARLEQAQLYKAGAIQRWPYCEGYIATEAMRQGLKTKELSEYGDASRYDWWPPFLEKELPRLARYEFVHPVLDSGRYTPSLLKYDLKLGVMLSPMSWLHRKLRLVGPSGYLRSIVSPAFRRGLWRSLRQRFGVLPASEGGFNEVAYTGE